MLVLSRKPNEKILFPSLGISVEVRSVSKNVVRVGINAPPSIAIVREEIASESEKLIASQPPSNRHRLRNRLHVAGLAVSLAQKQLQAGRAKEAENSLNEALREYADLDHDLAAEKVVADPPRRPISALLVDDNFNECALLAEFLRLHQFQVQTAHDGQEALDYLGTHDRPDVVLLDMRMPRCDGPTTISAIRRNPAYEGLKVLAVSGTDPGDCPMPKGQGGVDGWFTKPLDPSKLIREVKMSLRNN